MGIILSHPTSNEFNRAAAAGMVNKSILLEFHTTIAIFPGSFLDRFVSLSPLVNLKRRSFSNYLKSYIRPFPYYELGRHVAYKAGLNKMTKHETGLFSVDAVYRTLDKKVAAQIHRSVNKEITGVYAYEDGAISTFIEAKKLGINCFYDLPIGYWRAARRLLENERKLHPEWASTITGFQDSDVKLFRKDKELQLADKIFVASKFTANTLSDYPGPLAPIYVIPYGFPSVAKNRGYSSPYMGKPLKLLFVGGLSQRKGISYLFDAVESLSPHVRLTIVGHKASHTCPALDAALAKHHWIPSLPHADILKLMQSHDVLVFPSLFEGFGLVITEAMSQGTPVITTDRTAGPDIIEHGQNGWLVEAGSANALQEAIEKLIQQPSKIANAGKAAMETARKRPWEVYGRELAAAVYNY